MSETATWQDVLGGRARWCVVEGDCLDVLPGMPVDLAAAVVTDPPYGIGLDSHGQLFRGAGRIAGDGDTRLAEQVYEFCANRGCPLAMFFSPFRWFTNGWRSVLVWDKGLHVGAGGDRGTCWKRDVEMIGVAFNRPLNGGRDSSVLHFNAISPNFVGLRHPSEKPVALMCYLVEKLTRHGETVMEPFAGSGTTGVACLQTGRRCVLIERDPEYAALARKRLAAVDAACPLFEPARQGDLFDEGVTP